MSEKPSSNGEDMDDLLLRYGGPLQHIDTIRAILARCGITTREELRNDIELYESHFGIGKPPDFSGDEKALEETASALEAMKTMFISHEVEPYHETE